jgi:hypothetical protein
MKKYFLDILETIILKVISEIIKKAFEFINKR